MKPSHYIQQQKILSPPNITGFSLLELMVVISITMIIITFAAPSFGSLVSRSQIESKANTVFDIFQLARGTAISQGEFITLCPSTDGQQCLQQWQLGLMAFIDNNHDRKFSGNDKIITFLPSTSSATLHGNQPYFTYNPLGALKGRMGSLITCPAGEKESTSIRLLVSQMGRVRTQEKHKQTHSTCKDHFKY
ncbi:hypothetical protein A9Q81_25940 [Gammaproteobacteria bacterium 42_54_T18]|nr:hypothetical protein A9Q81_25940 [Gammaproteobacteria bacterium 42_54_T18]